MDEVEEVKQRIDIVELVGEYVPLKRSGKNFKGLCPFHTEKTPSFMVSPDRQTWHCFGCSLGGDVISFLMQIERLEFPEALAALAARAGIELAKRSKQDSQGIKERLLAINHLSQEFYHHLLLHHEAARHAREYAGSRGISKESVGLFKLGYAPNSWDSLRRFLIKKGFTDAEMLTCGLTIAKANHPETYDRFRGRLMFPLQDHHGNIIGFAGRTLGTDLPKYINSPETPLFIKGNVLYGLNLAKQAIRKEKRAIVVEGELDALLAHQHGTEFVVASKGTSLTETQIRLLKRYTQTVDLGFDPDRAGSMATLRGIELAKAQGLMIRVIKLPEGDDPASLISQNKADLWDEAIDRPIPVYDYWFETILEKYSVDTAFGKQQIAQTLLPIFSHIEDTVTRGHYFQKLAALLKADEAVLREEATRLKREKFHSALKVPKEVNFSVKGRQKTSPVTKLEQHYLALLFQSRGFDSSCFKELTVQDFEQKEYRELYQLITSLVSGYNEEEKVTLHSIEEVVPLPLQPLVSELLLLEVLPNGWTDMLWKQEVLRIKAALLQAKLKARLHSLSLEMKAAEVTGDQTTALATEIKMREAVEQLSKVQR